MTLTTNRRAHGSRIVIGRGNGTEASGDCARAFVGRDGAALCFLGDVAGHDAEAAMLALSFDPGTQRLRSRRRRDAGRGHRRITDPLASDVDPLGTAALTRLVGRALPDPSSICASLLGAAERTGLRGDATVLAVAPPLRGAASSSVTRHSSRLAA
jgi:hypothetical protein